MKTKKAVTAQSAAGSFPCKHPPMRITARQQRAVILPLDAQKINHLHRQICRWFLFCARFVL